MTAGRSIGNAAEMTGAGPVRFDPEAVAAAHRQVRADPSIQFDLPWPPVEPRDPPPEWLLAVGRFLGRVVEAVGGGWQFLLWGAVAILVIVLLLAVAPGVRAWLAERFGRRGEPDEPVGWTPDAATARALLDEAEQMAADGRYAEAVHLLLFRSIEDIATWRGDLVRPAFTSRDIARSGDLPGEARRVFAGIVAAVERSLFGGRALGVADWRAARDAYAGFALGTR